jgi:SSS family solute:Na+ symporter
MVVFVAYTALGGLWAATISDLAQLAIAAVGVGVAAAVVMLRVDDGGGMHALVANRGVGPSYFNPVGGEPSFVLWLLIPTVMYTLIGQDFYQRLFATRDARTARVAALAGGVFLVAVSALPVVVGMGARALSPLPMDAGDALPWVLRELMPPVVGGVILAAILAAIMSTADSLLTSATSHVVHDLWRRDDDETRQLRRSRVVTVAIGALALLLGLSLPGIVTTLIYAYTMYSAGILVPVLGGVLWKRATRPGAIAAALAGSLVAAVGLATGLEVAGIPTEIYAAAVSAVAFVLVSLATPPPPYPGMNDA